jgi:TonB-linked SusC/RagA family outer membrane protein
MRKNLRFFLVMFFLAFYFLTFGQERTVTGNVTDETGAPLPGVSVVIQGTTSGTITDIDGNYSITLEEGQDVLRFSFIGFKDQFIEVGTRSVVDVQMVPEIRALDEVVVVGYGTAKKSNLTTSQTAVTAEEMEKTVNTTVGQAIQGRTAGVYVTQNSGQPGGGISVNIRGVNSINGSNEPLYVIDGVQIQSSGVSYGSTSSSNPLSTLNPDDIKDIQVLQGPSATAIYGSRATNGVLLITTKRGEAGDARVNYNYSYSMQTPPEKLDVMNLSEYAQMTIDLHEIEGGNTPDAFMDPSILGEGTDWQEELFRTTGMHKHQLSMSGGSDKSTYYVSGEYLDQEGVAIGSGFERYSFRLNADNQPFKWLKLQENVSFSQTKEKLSSTSEQVISNALQMAPHIPVRNIDGTWGGNKNDPNQQYAPANPLAIAQQVTNKNKKREVNGGLNLDIKILKGLHFRSSLNGNLSRQNSIYFQPKMKIGWYEVPEANMSDNISESTYYNWNQLIQFNRQFNDHALDVMLTHEMQESTWKGNNASIRGFLTNEIIDLNAGDKETSSVSGGHNSWAMESYLGRLNYNFREKYLLTASVRHDGSSNFGANNRWGTFPAASVAWRIEKEPWFNVPFINMFKLRGEFGVTGNQSQGGIYSPMMANSTEWGTGFLPSKYGNPDLQWEETQTNNVGLNLHFLDNRIQFEFDYYMKETENLLMQAALPGYMGTKGNGGPGAPTINLGALENEGWGLTLISTNIHTPNFRWETNFNMSSNETVITRFNSESAIVDRTSWWMNDWTQRSVVGKAPWLFMGYKYDGIFQSVEEIKNSPIPVNNNGERLPVNEENVWVGDVKYKDVSGPDGKPDGVIDVNDRTFIGNPWPEFFGGMTNTFSYKNFDLSVVLTFVYGNDLYNYVAMNNYNPSQINLGRNLFSDAKNYAHLATNGEDDVYITNPETDLPRISYGTNGNWERFSDRWVEDGSYIKIKNISLGYNLPSTLLSQQDFFQNVRFTVSAQNVFTFTDYSGYDPEIGSYVGANASSANQAIGIDNGRYPLTPTYTFNVKLNF